MRLPDAPAMHGRIAGRHSSSAGHSEFLKRQPAQPGRIPYPGLRDLNDLHW